MKLVLLIVILCSFSASAVGYIELYPIVPHDVATSSIEVCVFPDFDYDYCDYVVWDKSVKYLDYSGNSFIPKLSDINTVETNATQLSFYAPPRFTEGQKIIVSFMRLPEVTAGITTFNKNYGGEVFWRSAVTDGCITIFGSTPPVSGISNMTGMSVSHDSTTNLNYYAHPFNAGSYSSLLSDAILANFTIRAADTSWGLVATDPAADTMDVNEDGIPDKYSFLQLYVLSRVDGYQPFGELNIIMLNPYADRQSNLYEGKLIQWTGFEIMHSGQKYTVGPYKKEYTFNYVAPSLAHPDTISDPNNFGIDPLYLTPLKDAACLFPAPPYSGKETNEFIMCLSAPPYNCYGVNSLPVDTRDIQCPLDGTDHNGNPSAVSQHFQRYIPPCRSDLTDNKVADVHYYNDKSVMQVADPMADPFYRVPDVVDNKPLVRCWFSASNNLENIYKNNILAGKGWAAGTGANLMVDGSKGINNWAPIVTTGINMNLAELGDTSQLYGKYICVKIIIYTNSNTCNWLSPYTTAGLSLRLPGNDNYVFDPTIDAAAGANPTSSVFFDAPPFNLGKPRPYFFYNDRTMTPQIRGLKMYFAKFDINIHLTGFNNFLEYALDGTKYEDWRIELGENTLYEVKHRK